MIRLENLLSRRKRITDKKIFPVRHIAVMEETFLRDVIQRMDYDMFHIIFIIDGSHEIIGRLTEEHIIRALENCSIDDKMSDILRFLADMPH